MYKIIKLVENLKRFFIINIKIFYWKIKYGKRIIFGKRIRFRKRMQINLGEKAKLIIGDDTAFNNDCSINCHKYIKIGKKNMFGEGVKIYDHNHIFNNKKIDRRYSYKEGNIEIGDNNWFGTNVIILSKTKVGNNNVFASGVVINETIDDDVLIRNKVSTIKEKIEYKEV